MTTQSLPQVLGATGVIPPVFLTLKYVHRVHVGAVGFEPTTSWSQTKRSNRAEPRPESLVNIIYAAGAVNSKPLSQNHFRLQIRYASDNFSTGSHRALGNSTETNLCCGISLIDSKDS